MKPRAWCVEHLEFDKGGRDWIWRSRGTARHAVHQITQEHNVETSARRAPMHVVQPFERRRMEKKWSCTACTTARRSSLFESQNGGQLKMHGVHHCMSFPCFWYAEQTPLEGARRAPLYGVHLPKSSCYYKKGSWRKEKPFFPNSIFHDFPRAFPAKTSTKTPLEAKLKIQRSSY